MLDIALLSDCAVSVSSSRVALSANGGYTRAAANLVEVRRLVTYGYEQPGWRGKRLVATAYSQ